MHLQELVSAEHIHFGNQRHIAGLKRPKSSQEQKRALVGRKTVTPNEITKDAPISRKFAFAPKGHLENGAQICSKSKATSKSKSSALFVARGGGKKPCGQTAPKLVCYPLNKFSPLS